jgi:hypothetical protein
MVIERKAETSGRTLGRKRWLLAPIAVAGLMVMSLMPVGAVSLYNVNGADGHLKKDGSVRVTIPYLCPKDQNPGNGPGAYGVVLDVSLTQEANKKNIEGESTVWVNCADKWRSKTVTVTVDMMASTGTQFVKGQASEKVSLDALQSSCTNTDASQCADGVDVASNPTGKDGTQTVEIE